MSSVLQTVNLEFQHSTCALCGILVQDKLMFCSKCRVVVYCSKEHQVAHWKRHKRFCKEHLWKKDNPISGSCRVPTCPCKTWYGKDHLDPLLVAQPSNGYDISTASSSTSNQADETQWQPTLLSAPTSSNGILSPEPIFMNETTSGDNDKSMYATILNHMYTGAVNDVASVNNTTKYVGSRVNQQLSFNGNSVESNPTLSQVASALLPSYGAHLYSGVAVEDLENYAPASGHVFGIPNTNHSEPQSHIFQPSHPHSTKSSVVTQSYGQFTPGTGAAFTERTLHRSNSASFPSTLSSSSSSSTLLKLSLSEDSKTCVNEDDAVISGSDNRQGLDISQPLTNSSAAMPFRHTHTQYIAGQSALQTKLWINQVWQEVIEDMDQYGVCVVDNLLGEARGGAVLREVQNLYSKGAFQDGQLVKSKDGQSKSIRGDKITWVDGGETQCRNINVLIKLLDNIVMGANNRQGNGKLGTYSIKERSKAMVACYPGSGTHYVKHVDNPNDDGRCVTAIYYLNKDWNTQENGGLLRIFPEGWSHQVADIEPLFDRVIFFWSDRRNPHEVQPAYKTRYAITLWYFDSKAKARAKMSADAKNISALK